VSRSGYYEWKKTHENRERRAQDFAQTVQDIFNNGRGVYGIERICGILRTQGKKASFRRVKKVMEDRGLKSVHLRRRQRSLTDSRKSRGEGYVNLVRGRVIERPFQVLSSDISYIRTKEGFEYLCQVKDVVSGVILAESMSERMKAELVVDTIRKAVKGWALPSGCIFHSDRGSQYTSEKVKGLLTHYGLRQSFSRVGKPGDNAWSESFFANLKKEAVHWTQFKTKEEAQEAMFAYIEGFYNTKRVQKRLGYLSPTQWLEKWLYNHSVEAA